MKKILLFLLPFLFIACNFSGKFPYEFKNESSYDIKIKINSTVYDIASGKSLFVDIVPADPVSVKDNDRVELVFKYSGRYNIIDKEYYSITVFNSSTHDIILYEKNCGRLTVFGIVGTADL